MSWVCLEQLLVLSRESLHMPWQFVITSPERSKRMGTSRHRPEVSLANLGVDLFQSGGVLSARRKVLFQFFVPNELILPRGERGELGQLFTAQLFYRCLYFRQAHAPTVAAATPEANQIAARSGFRVLDGVPLERARWIGHMGSNVPAHRRRASDVRLSTAARSRRSVRPVCWAFF